MSTTVRSLILSSRIAISSFDAVSKVNVSAAVVILGDVMLMFCSTFSRRLSAQLS